MPRIVNLVQRGLVKFAIGSPDVLVDWYVNLRGVLASEYANFTAVVLPFSAI